MRTGSLSELICIQKPTASKDAYGEYQPETWVSVRDVWSEVKPLMPGLGGIRGVEVFQADQLVAKTIYQFTIHRPDFDILENYRIVWRGKNYYIKSIHEVLRDVGLVMFAEKKDAQQT